MTSLKCPHCGGELLLISADFSPAARAILDHGPAPFLRGEEVPIQLIADTIGYSYSVTQAALVELAGKDRVNRRRLGKRKHGYSLKLPQHKHR